MNNLVNIKARPTDVTELDQNNKMKNDLNTTHK